MVLVSRAQSAQVAWLREPGVETAQGLLRTFLGPTDGVYWACLGLAVLGLAGLVGRRGEVTCAGVCLPLSVVPPAVLMLVSQLSPLYVDRYVLYALSGAPLLVAAGAERVAGAAGRLWARGRPAWHSPLSTLAGLLALGLVLAQQLPLLRGDRSPAHRPDDLASVSRTAERRLRAGDCVLFLPVQTRNAALTYPGAFRGARDVALARTAADSGTLYGQEVSPGTLRRRTARLERVWVVADRDLLGGRWRPGSPTERAKLALLAREFVPREEWVQDDVAVRLYVRPGRVSGPAKPLAEPPRPARS